MTSRQIAKLVRDAAPTCSAADGQSDRYRVWLEHPDRVIKARTKSDLRDKLTQALKDNEIVKRHAMVRRDGYDVPLIGIPEEAVLETCDCCGETIGISTATFTGTQILCCKCMSPR